MNLSHRTALDWLHRERDGRLDGPSRAELAGHLAACSQCRSSAALVRRLELAGSDLPLPYGPQWAPDRQIVREILQARHRQQLVWEPLKGLAWAAAAVLLAFLLSWSIEILRPGGTGQTAGSGPGPLEITIRAWGGKIEQAVEIPPLAPPGFSSQEFEEWLYRNFYLAGLVPLLLAGLLGVFLGTRQAEITWLAFLLGGVVFGMVFLFWGIGRGAQGNAMYSLLAIPFLAAMVAMLVNHLWSTPRFWTRGMLAILLTWAGGLILLVAGPWYGYARSQVFSEPALLFVLSAGLIPAILWQAWGWKGWRRWIFPLILLFSLAGMFLSILGYFSSLPGEAPWPGVVAGLGILLWPVISVVSAARLGFAWLSSRRPISRFRTVMGAAAVILLFGTLVALVRLQSIQNSVAEDPFVGIFLLLWTDVTALMACAAITWTLQGRRMGAAIALVFLFAFAMIPAAKVPAGTAERVTEQRAEEINQAILRFHGETGRYPASLDELAPGYLFLLPPPIDHWQKTWCYDGGAEFYRLGYATPVYFAYPGDIEVRLYASAGVLPSLIMPCEAELQKIKDKAR